MSKIKGEDVKELVWGVCEILADLEVTETKPGIGYDKDELQDRYSIAFLTNPSLFDLLDDEVSINKVVDFIESIIKGFGYIPCGSVKYIEALLVNPGLFKMVASGRRVVKV